MAAVDREEFHNALNEIAQRSSMLVSPYDRVRCCEWAHRLIRIPDNNIESARTRNEYIQLLRIMVRSQFLHGIFLNMPPEGDLCPLPEALGNDMCSRVPQLPRVGPIAPVMTHRTQDGLACVSIKCVPGGGVFCYMAVTPGPEGEQ